MPARRLEWAVAGGMSAMALARITAADRWPLTSMQLVALMSFTPHAAAAAWLAALALRDRRAASVTALAAATLTGVALPRAVARRQPQAAGPELRVLTANFLVGRAQAGPVVSLVRAARADVLLAQELTTGLAGALAAAGLTALLPHAIEDAGSPGASGNAVYSRYPIAADPDVPSRSWARPATKIELPSGAARLVCVHLHTPRPSWSQDGVSDWRDQLRELPSMLAPGDPPAIIAGDFNSTLDHAEFRRLLRGRYADAAAQAGLGHLPTWNANADIRAGLLTIDHVLVDPRCAVLGVSVHRIPGSDHRAVLARIRLP